MVSLVPPFVQSLFPSRSWNLGTHSAQYQCLLRWLSYLVCGFQLMFNKSMISGDGVSLSQQAGYSDRNKRPAHLPLHECVDLFV
jgi:hypothetical protein